MIPHRPTLIHEHGPAPLAEASITTGHARAGCCQTTGEAAASTIIRSRMPEHRRPRPVAAWIWNIATAKFPEATRVVGLYHAREHLSDLARCLEFMLGDGKDAWLAVRSDGGSGARSPSATHRHQPPAMRLASRVNDGPTADTTTNIATSVAAAARSGKCDL